MLKKLLITVISVFTFCTFADITPARELTPVPHWQKKEINVYIPKTEDNKTVSAVKSAFSTWQNASAGHIKFKYATNGPADIDIVFCANASGSASPYTNTKVSKSSNQISKAEISIASESEEYKKLNSGYISKVLLNEVGKALGVPSNTTKPSSIMHDPVTEKQRFLKVDAMKLFSVSEWSYSKRNIDQRKEKEKKRKGK